MKFLFLAMRESLEEGWDFDTIICFYWVGALGPELYNGLKHKQN